LQRPRWIIILLAGFSFSSLYGQVPVDGSTGSDSSNFILTICKRLDLVPVHYRSLWEARQAPSDKQLRKPLLVASGDLGYQLFSRTGPSDNLLLINARSDIATLRLNVLYKEIYPVSVSFRYNQSSPFQLDNQYEANISFDDRSFKEILHERIARITKNNFLSRQAVLLHKYETAFRELKKQKDLLRSPAYVQGIIEQRLRQSGTPAFMNTLPSIPNTVNPLDRIGDLVPNTPGISDIKQQLKDSLQNRLAGLTNQAHDKMEGLKDSLERVVLRLEDSLSQNKLAMNKQLDSINRELSALRSPGQIKEYASLKGLADSLPRNNWADLLMRTSLRFGKFILDNSELTVSNIFLHGASIRYGTDRFVWISGGYYDFAFRQVFNFRSDTIPRQRSSVFAIKMGKTDGYNLSAVSFYIGRKEKAGSVAGDLRTVAGVSTEKNISLAKNTTLAIELAKSTTRSINVADKVQPVIKDLFTNFNTRTIGAYGSLKAFLPRTKTDAEVNYRYWGTQFESFNSNQYYNPQNNAMVRVSQPLFNRRLNLSGNIRYTDFKTYGVSSNIRNSTFFASLNGTLRIRKIPVVSVGYYPGSQLYWLDNSKLYEYFYYIFNTTVSHYFRVGKMPMQGVFTWNKFFNKYSDSLVSNAQSYYNLFFTTWIGQWSLQANYSRQELESKVLNTYEGGLQYTGRSVRLGGSLKCNMIGDMLRTGYTGNIGMVFKKIGTISFIYDQSYLPGSGGDFIPVTTGQLQLIKPLKFTVWQKDEQARR
jgi:hypothetical protein